MTIQETVKLIWKYIYFLQENKEFVTSVNISNTFRDSFGRAYCDFNIDIVFKADLVKLVQDKIKASQKGHFLNYTSELDNVFSFYIGKVHEIGDLENNDEKIYYAFVSEFLVTYLTRHNIPTYVDNFKTLNSIIEERKIKSQIYYAKQKVLIDSLADIKILTGYYLFTKNIDNFRIRYIKEVVYGTKNKIVSITTNDVLSKLEISHNTKESTFFSVDDFYVIFSIIPKCKDKNELIDYIKNNQSFEGQIWRRPNELW